MPIVDGKISLPDLSLEHETPEGERAHIDLELATENYRPAHMRQKLRAGLKIYGVNSTSRGRRAEVGRSRTDGPGTGAMSARVMTRHERTANVQRLGYAHAEAELLTVVALPGGYFVRRQFDAWIGLAWGKRSGDFLAHLLDRGHGYRQVFARNRQVFSVRIRPLYRAGGDENSRNRREHQPQAIKARLMTLDYVLTHSENRYFSTECETVAHVCDERGTDHGALPVKVVRSPDGASSTPRYFLDRFPLFTRPGSEDMAVCYIDSGFETSCPFASCLRQYLPLCIELPTFDLVDVATASPRLGRAQAAIERVLSRSHKWLAKVVDPDRLLAHFRDRQLFEKRKPAASIGSRSMRYATTCTVVL